MIMTQVEHEKWMSQAIQIAKSNPRKPFGSVIVDNESNTLIAEGINRSSENPTWHGEIDAINQAKKNHPDIEWSKLTLYTTAEPCSMCQSAIVWAGFAKVVFGTSIPTLMELGFHQTTIRADEVIQKSDWVSCELIGGILEDECDQLFKASDI